MASDHRRFFHVPHSCYECCNCDCRCRPHAADVDLTRAIQGATFQEGGVARSLYCIAPETAYRVVATYIVCDDAYDLKRMQIGLVDGDSVTFTLLGDEWTHFTFTRDGELARVSANAVERLEQVT